MKKPIVMIEKVINVFSEVTEAFHQIKDGMEKENKADIENGIQALPSNRTITNALEACEVIISEKQWDKVLDEISED